MTRSRRPAQPGYTVRRVLLGIVAIILLASVLGAVAWAVSGPVSAMIHATASTPAAKRPPAELPETAITTEPAQPDTVAVEVTESAPATSSAPTTAAPVTIVSVGDMMFGRSVSDYIDENGGRAVFAKVAGVMRDADLRLGNLEGPLAARGSEAIRKDATPAGNPKAVVGLKSVGFNAVGLANDHVMDYGASALTQTIRLLDAARIAHAGAGPSWAAARRAATLEANGAKVAFLSFSDIVPGGIAATADHGGVAGSKGRMNEVRAAVSEARTTHGYVVVMFHWGIDNEPDANSEQRALAHGAVDAGADLVLGSHPHVIQGIETYKGRLIAYSLGDFVSDHSSRVTGESFVLRTTLGPGGVTEVRITPTYLGMASGRPSVVTGPAAATILKRLKTISADLGTNIVIDGDTATVETK